MTKLLEAFRWWRLGVSWKKAIQLAGLKRKERYHRELGLLLVIAAAYAIVGHNDLADARITAAMERDTRVKLERNVVRCLNGEHILLNKTDYMDCYVQYTWGSK